MSSSEWALIVAVPEAERVVRHLPKGIPAHITLLVPFVPDNTDLRAFFGGQKPFRFVLEQIGRFPQTLYLAPDPARPFRELTEKLAALFPDYPPYSGRHREIIPHLTVDHDQPDATLYATEQEIRPLLPVHATAREVQLLEHLGERWIERDSFLLG